MTSPPPGTRPHNLARILRLVHEDGAQSRAALTAATGLNRSTIADLVAELVERGLVEEKDPGTPGRVGRPSPVVSASAANVAIAVNPEVDAIEIAAVGLDRTVVIRARREQHAIPSPHAVADVIAEQIASWREGALAGARIVSIGIAVPGLVRASDGVVRLAPHLAWRDVALADIVSAATGLPVLVGNDATLGAMAEHRYGAGRGVDDVVYLNGGASGIGGGLIVHGRPVVGAGGYAGEFGQNRPRLSVEPDRGGTGGTLEAEVSRRLLLDAIGLDAADDETLAAGLLALDAAAAQEEVTRQARVLASTLADAVNVLNPALIILGGFLATLWTLRADLIFEEVAALAMAENAADVQIRPAALGSDRLLVGAAELAFAPLLSSAGVDIDLRAG